MPGSGERVNSWRPGSADLLGLVLETDGVLARYEINGSAIRLLLVTYPSRDRVWVAVDALKGSDVSGLLAMDATGNVLAAVFGDSGRTTAELLLVTALAEAEN